jgi:hypothetical protein
MLAATMDSAKGGHSAGSWVCHKVKRLVSRTAALWAAQSAMTRGVWWANATVDLTADQRGEMLMVGMMVVAMVDSKAMKLEHRRVDQKVYSKARRSVNQSD